MGTNKRNNLRVYFQILIITLLSFFAILSITNFRFNPDAYCPYGGLQALSGYFVTNSLACDMTTVQVLLGVLMVVFIILIGKLFCSYICPIGFISELLIKLRKHLNIKEIEIRNYSVTDILLRSLKYILLFVTFYFSISSSELFCKIIDPYYALATHFKGELYVWLSLGIVYLLIFGGIFIKMFWCKYICPIGAISNIIKYLYISVILVLLFVMFKFVGINISWIVILAIFSVAGYLCEILFPTKTVLSLFKITRDKSKCEENCNDCIKTCPFSIEINHVEKVKDIDCTLCGNCIAECKYSALSINKRKNLHLYFPFIIIIIIIAGIYLGKKWEMPTINLKWGDYNEKSLSTFEIENLRSVKCYASSINFAKKITDIKGIYGVKTFINHHRVKIFYNKSEIADTAIRRLIYSPIKFKIKSPDKGVRKIKVITFHTENMPDPVDVNYLGMHFRKIEKKLYGLESSYSIPLSLKLYVDESESIDENFLKENINLKEITIQLHGGKERVEKVDYKFISLNNKVDTISKRAFLEHFFKTYKKYFVDFDTNRCSQLDVVYPDLDKPLVYRALPTLANYLSSKNGILGIETTLNESDEYTLRIYYSEKLINIDSIELILKNPKWEIISDKKTKMIDALLKF